MELTEEDSRQFAEQGFLKKDFALDPELLDAIVQQVVPRYEPAEFEARHPGTRVQDAWQELDSVRRLAMDASILAALSRLFGREPKPFQTLNFPFGTQQAPHSDTIHFNSIPHGFMAGVWVALEDIDEDNGPLIYYPGSHKLPELSMQDLGLKPSYSDYPEYESKLGLLIEERQLSRELGVMEKGTTLIWHANLLHGGAPQNDPARTRHSQVTHVFFDRCKYYTPMNSKFWRRAYRQPSWITAQAQQPVHAD